MSFNPVGAVSGFLGGQAGGVPGVGGYDYRTSGDYSNQNPNFQPVPGQPGKFYDTASGQVVTQDPATGNMTVTAAPNSNQLTAQNTTAAQGLQAAQGGTLGGIGANLSAENGAVSDFNNTISNPNAPSAARSQLVSTLNSINGQQEAIAAGASGNNTPMANRTMAQDIAGSQIAANGQAANLRAGEVANAEAGKAGVLGAEGSQLGNLYSTQGAQAVGYTNSATQNQGNVLKTQEANNEYNATANSNLVGNLGGSLTSLAAL